MNYEVVILSDENNAVNKNKILDIYKDKKVKYLFLKEAAIKVEDIVFEEYIKLMEKYDIPCVFYGYTKDNILFNGVPNPMARCKTKDGYILLTRYPGKSLIGIDLEKIGDRRFDENLKELDMELYLFQLAMDKLLPSYGFFIDINNPWEHIENLNKETDLNIEEYNKEIQRIEKDKKYLQENNIVLTSSLDLDNIIKYVLEKEKENDL
jgi:hypothetical protein